MSMPNQARTIRENCTPGYTSMQTFRVEPFLREASTAASAGTRSCLGAPRVQGAGGLAFPVVQVLGMLFVIDPKRMKFNSIQR
jgi:hypothetical protein